jgi:hypothetical protein
VPARLGDRVRELVAGRRNDSGNARLVVRHGAIRLEDHQQHVVALEPPGAGFRQRHPRQVAIRIRRRRRDEESRLLQERRRDRQRVLVPHAPIEPRSERVERDDRGRERADDAAAGRHAQRMRDCGEAHCQRRD